MSKMPRLLSTGWPSLEDDGEETMRRTTSRLMLITFLATASIGAAWG
jgi:hypothetical protein